MTNINDLRKVRLEKLEAIKSVGILPYPAKVKRTSTINDALSDFDKLAKEEKEIILAGRIRAQRGHGGLLFLDLTDASGKIQLILKKNRVGEEDFDFFVCNIDIGDFIEVRGILFETQKKEKTLEIASYKILTKSLLPLPDKWCGISDIEERFRKRYLDLLCNEDVKKKFVLRANIIKEIRNFLEKEGFMEVETPVLQPLYGGTEAKPFKTHLNALDMDLYLRIAPELYLKRLIVGGFEKIYEIGKCFRNEGVDKSHNPDFTMLEFYWAYADDKDMMKLAEKMFEYFLKKSFGTLEIERDGKIIDFKAPWERIEYDALIKKYAKVDIISANRDTLFKKAKELEVKVENVSSKAQIEDAIYKKYCLPQLWNPTFVIHHPEANIGLAKPLDEDPTKLGSIQLVVAGWELVKAYAELNDPIRQKNVFQEQEDLFVDGVEDAQRMDTDYIEALEYGMPPTAGFGMGIDRLVTLLTNSKTLREMIFFPTMKSKENTENRDSK